jgi:tetratricopeptide (TPR) repeat protein
MSSGSYDDVSPQRLDHDRRCLKTITVPTVLISLFFLLTSQAGPQNDRQDTALGTQPPSNVSALMSALETQLKSRQRVAVQRTVEQLTRLLSPKDPRFFQAASLCALHEDYTTAIPLMERLREALPESYDANYNLSLAYFRTKDYSKAVEILQTLVIKQPRAEAYNLLATVQEQRKHYLDAVRAFQKAAELQPDNEDYRYDYAFELLKHKTDRAAIAIFASGVRDFPRSVKLRLGLGCAYYVVGKQEEAARILLEAIKIEPRHKLAYLFLGKTYEQAGPLQTAITEAFRAYLERGPQDPWAHYHYGRILYLVAQSAPNPDFQAAKSYLQRAVSLNPQFAESYVQLATVLQTEDQNKESLAFLDQAIRSNPKLTSAHYRLGLAYRRLGERDKAAAEFALSEKLNAEDQAGREKQSVIQFLVEPGK